MIDVESGNETGIEMEHAKIHAGKSFSCHYTVTTASTDDHRTAIGFKTPSSEEHGHLVATVFSSHAAEVFILEAPTIDDDAGTALTILNRKRESAIASVMKSLMATPVVGGATSFDEAEIAAATFSGGTELEYIPLVAEAVPKPVGGVSRGVQEWELKPDTKYLFIVKNRGANANLHWIQLDWYEHVDRHEESHFNVE